MSESENDTESLRIERGQPAGRGGGAPPPIGSLLRGPIGREGAAGEPSSDAGEGGIETQPDGTGGSGRSRDEE